MAVTLPDDSVVVFVLGVLRGSLTKAMTTDERSLKSRQDGEEATIQFVSDQRKTGCRLTQRFTHVWGIWVERE